MSKELSLSKEDMRKLGYQAVDILVNHLTTLKDKNVTRRSEKKKLVEVFQEPIPREGMNPFKLLSMVETQVFDNTMHVNHPRFFAFVSSPSNYVSVLADFLSTGFNIFSGTWLQASAPAQIELTTINWLTEFFGLPRNSSGGLFLSGGSMANLTGLILAREHVKSTGNDGVIYYSDQTHSSIEKGAKVLGKEGIQVRKISTTNHFKLDIDALERSIKEDREKGLQPLCIVANAGTTNTGAIDDLAKISKICQRENIWFHVDGAYGGVAILCEVHKEMYRGIEYADSIGIDPHKWFFQPYEIGCLLVRNRKKLKDVFYVLPEYLKDTNLSDEEINYSNYGIQLTRGFRAFKIWLSLKAFGLDSFKQAIQYGIELAQIAELEIRKYSHWEVVSPAQIGIINFRFVQKRISEKKLNELNQKLIDEIVRSGFAMISSTVLHNKTVIRLCIINPRTTVRDIKKTIKLLNENSERISKTIKGENQTGAGCSH